MFLESLSLSLHTFSLLLALFLLIRFNYCFTLLYAVKYRMHLSKRKVMVNLALGCPQYTIASRCLFTHKRRSNSYTYVYIHIYQYIYSYVLHIYICIYVYRYIDTYTLSNSSYNLITNSNRKSMYQCLLKWFVLMNE